MSQRPYSQLGIIFGLIILFFGFVWRITINDNDMDEEKKLQNKTNIILSSIVIMLGVIILGYNSYNLIVLYPITEGSNESELEPIITSPPYIFKFNCDGVVPS